MKRLLSLTVTLMSLHLPAQDRFAEVEISTQHIAGSTYMLTGSGGNIGVSAGKDGILIIDDQFEPLATRIAKALSDIADTDIRYVINTHYHGDHTGSNAWFQKIEDTTIFAHDNVRSRLAEKPEHRHGGLPVVTYDNGIKFHFNDDTLHVMHLPSGHTDGDSIVRFEKANVVHTGDLFFVDRFPYVDLKAGGTVEGYMNNIQTILDRTDAETRFIPGHGPLATRKQYQNLLSMIKETRALVQTSKAAGKSLDDIIEAGLGDKWKSWSWQFIDEKRWITTLYQ
ncbi:MAG: MBL fold metallo-hydrolase [Endozoicomonas sp.]